MSRKFIAGDKIESVVDFKQRIAAMMRERETGKKYSLIGAAPADPCVVRKKKGVAHLCSCANMSRERKDDERNNETV